jgi:hypothetical protein
MAGVFREMTIKWAGESYTLTPSMTLMRRIDREVSVMDMIQRANDGRFPAFDLAYVICEFLRAAGAKDVSDDEVYAHLMDDLGENDGKEVMPMLNAVIAAVSPSEGDEKKPERRAGKQKKAAA